MMKAEKLPTSALVMHDGYAKLTPQLHCELPEAVAIIKRAIADCRSEGIERLFIDMRELTGFAPPTIAERWYLVCEWAEAAEGRVKMALVARPEIIDPDRIGVTVARNRAFLADIFDDDQAALEWLME